MSYNITGYKLKPGDSIENLAYEMDNAEDEYDSEMFTDEEEGIIKDIIMTRYGTSFQHGECSYKELTITYFGNQISFTMPYWEESLSLYDGMIECAIEIHKRTGVIFWDCQNSQTITTHAPTSGEMRKMIDKIPEIVKLNVSKLKPWWKIW